VSASACRPELKSWRGRNRPSTSDKACQRDTDLSIFPETRWPVSETKSLRRYCSVVPVVSWPTRQIPFVRPHPASDRARLIDPFSQKCLNGKLANLFMNGTAMRNDVAHQTTKMTNHPLRLAKNPHPLPDTCAPMRRVKNWSTSAQSESRSATVQKTSAFPNKHKHQFPSSVRLREISNHLFGSILDGNGLGTYCGQCGMFQFCSNHQPPAGSA
jgi:hypothetical protein